MVGCIAVNPAPDLDHTIGDGPAGNGAGSYVSAPLGPLPLPPPHGMVRIWGRIDGDTTHQAPLKIIGLELKTGKTKEVLVARLGLDQDWEDQAWTKTGNARFGLRLGLGQAVLNLSLEYRYA